VVGLGINGIEVPAQHHGGDERQKGDIREGGGRQEYVPEAERQREGRQTHQADPMKLDRATAAHQVREHGGGQQESGQACSGEALAQGGEGRNQIERVFHEEGGQDGHGRPGWNAFKPRVQNARRAQRHPADQHSRAEAAERFSHRYHSNIGAFGRPRDRNRRRG